MLKYKYKIKFRGRNIVSRIMLKKIIKMLVVAVIVAAGVKNCDIGAVNPAQIQKPVGNYRSAPSELRNSQCVVDTSSMRLFKVLFNGGSIWKDEFFEKFVDYCCDRVIKADKMIDRKIFWDKEGNFNVYSFVDLRDGISRSDERVCLLFYDKSPYKFSSGSPMKYDVIAFRLPDEINVEPGKEYFPGEEKFIVEFVEEHILSKSYICISNDKWMVFFTLDFCKNHPKLEEVEDFEKGFNRALALLYNRKYGSLSMSLFYKHNKID